MSAGGDSLSGDQDDFSGSLAPFEALVNLGGFIKRVNCPRRATSLATSAIIVDAS
jgi:hypothetical protein